MAVLTIRLFCLALMFKISQSFKHHTVPPSFKMADKMGYEEKNTLMELSEDLLREATLRMRQIIAVRTEHETYISYNIGMLMGRIREKYRTMSEVYRDIVDKYHNGTWFRPPSIRYLRPLHYFVALERIHYLQMEIDKLVDVMVEEAGHELPKKRVIAGQTDPTERTKNSAITMGSGSRLRSQQEIVLEAVEKSFMRQRYLMKKLGNPVNMTTAKKRFLRHWPVEGSWSLDKYNYNYK